MQSTETRLPDQPGGYWRPAVSLSDVYYLRKNGTWWLSPDGVNLSVDEVPTDLVFLAAYA